MRRGFSACVVLLLFAFLSCAAPQANAQSKRNLGPKPITPAMERRVDAMVRKLTLRQKIELLGGQDSMYTHSEPRIGLPRLKMSDGPMGVRTWGPSTAYAAGIGLAASWDPSLAEKVGVGLGDDARARGVNFLLGPGVNIYRAPMDGRNFEFFGEDPYLASQIAVGYIDGVQSQGVSATIKHYDANNSEYDRGQINTIIDKRTLREIYLPVFEAAVKQAHVGAVMDSYNLVNGEHSTQNAFLNIQVLRKDWGFRGIVMSDWGGAHDTIGVANGGLDLEMPSGEYMNAETLLPAIRDGKVKVVTIDQKVRRILRTAMQFGFFDRKQINLKVPLYNQHSNQIALEAAEEGAVLLKNRGHLLPLDRHAIHFIAVLGPDAYPAVPTGGGSAHVDAFAPVSFMTGLSNSLHPGTKVYWNSGVESSESIFNNTKWCVDAGCQQPGLQRTDSNPSADSVANAPVDKTLNRMPGSWSGQTPQPTKWQGYFVPKTSGVYYIVLNTDFGDQNELHINGTDVTERDPRKGGPTEWIPITLQGGEPIQVEFTYTPHRPSSTASLGIVAEDGLIDPNAVRLAKMADVAVVSVGFDPTTESEGFDRTYTLPFGQAKLIQAVAAANPRTIVVLTSGGSVATEDWLGHVPVLLQTWYAGQQAGNALTKILFGDVNPSGKLPISWAKTVEDNPTYKNYYEPAGTHEVTYSEGIFVGYRYYATSGVQPLFPFGFGLSYTNFTFSNLSVSPETASPAGPIHVAFDVKNTGSVAGAEVAQIYVGDPSATVKRPKIELKGFSRVMLAPGASHHVTVTLDKRSLAYWDTATHGWKVDPGKFVVYVGDSSENLPLQQDFTVQ